jgi:hypothetical protein
MPEPDDAAQLVNAATRAALLREGIVVLAEDSSRGCRRVGVTGVGAERVREAVTHCLGRGVLIAADDRRTPFCGWIELAAMLEGRPPWRGRRGG